MKYWFLNRVPYCFRTRWPLRRYYWQKEDLEAIAKRVLAFRHLFGDSPEGDVLMAVALRQIRELYEILVSYVGNENIHGVLADLSKTEAYQANKSFHETIDRLVLYSQNRLEK